MAEGARLESVYTRKCIEGSNPSLTAIFELKAPTKVGAFNFCAIPKKYLVVLIGYNGLLRRGCRFPTPLMQSPNGENGISLL